MSMPLPIAPQLWENIFCLFLVKWSLNFAFTQAGGDICYHLNDIRKLVYNDDKISLDLLKHFSFVFVFYAYITSVHLVFSLPKESVKQDTFYVYLSDG